MKNVLVIVESSTKEKTIANYLKQLFKDVNFTVKASSGHICDVITENFGIDKTSYQPIYQVISDKQKIVSQLKQLSKKQDLVLLASDNDREGEAIAWHLKEVLRPKNYKRIIFNEITKPALEYAIKNQKDIDMNMVESQKTRRILDRLIGFNLSTVLRNTHKFNGTLSAGRVQSVVLGIIVEKEQAIDSFESEKYWNVKGDFEFDITDAKLTDINSKKILKFDNENFIVALLKKIKSINEYTVSNKEYKDESESPGLPFTTSTLQQKATSIGFSIKQTMKVAQELYELGHITYMRTDSTNISSTFQVNIVDFIKDNFGDKYLKMKQSNKKQKNAQEAHEAIRPTSLKRLDLKSDQKALYDLIFNRTIAYFMIPAVYKQISLTLTHEKLKDMCFLGKTKFLIEKGYKLVYEYGSDKKETLKSIDKELHKFGSLNKVKPIEIIGNCIWSSPPTRYTEASMIKKMEDTGIGRPSTYVSIINILYDRRYVTKTDVSGPKKDYTDYVLKNQNIKKKTFSQELYTHKNALYPSDIGKIISSYLSQKFNDIINVNYTSNKETELDEISNGHKTYIDTIRPFHDYITKKCNTLSKGSKTEIESYSKEMIIDNKKILVRDARYGPVIEIVQMKKYIPLGPFMKVKNIQNIKEITKDHVDFLMKYPVKYKDYIIHYKGYGFYVEKDKKTATIYPQYFNDLENNNYEFLEKIFKKIKK